MDLIQGQQLWEQALAMLKGSVDDESFATWLRPARFHELRGHTFTLSVPSPFYKNWLQSNFREKIVRTLNDLTSQEIDLDFFVVGPQGSDQPLSADVLPSFPSGADHEIVSASTTLPQAAQFPRSSILNPKYTFENYVVGESNRFAHAACRQVADPASKSYNPLFLYGGVGLGKTHLMHAIGHRILNANPRLRVLYVTSEQFMNSFIEAISQGKQFEFRDFYRNVDLLMIDDVQFFSGKERTQTEFFHTFNALYDAGKKILVSSDRPPKELTTLEDRLRNRFSWGLVVDIQPPDLETRIAILKKKSGITGEADLPNDVAVYIAERVQSNIRELEGVLVRLKAFSLLNKQPITMEMAKDVLGHLLTPEVPRQVDVEDIIETVCHYFELKRSDLLGTSRLKKFAGPRHIAQYLARKLTSLSYPEIGQRFGGRDHTSILHAFRKISDELERDENLKNLVAYLTKLIRNSRQA
jgi:chromosomal replication initiator protein